VIIKYVKKYLESKQIISLKIFETQYLLMAWHVKIISPYRRYKDVNENIKEYILRALFANWCYRFLIDLGEHS